MVIIEVATDKEPVMSIVVLQLPVVKRKTEVRPKQCPYCEGETFQPPCRDWWCPSPLPKAMS
jgi:hypothetical protein